MQSAQSAVLFDPILDDYFGHSPGTEFRVFPTRHLKISGLPHIDGIFISHEHLDHFHLPSLSRLDRSTPLYLGPLMPFCVEQALVELGFGPVRVPHHGSITFRDMTVTLFPSGHDTVIWENRVTSYLIRLTNEPELSVFLAVDALVSNEYVQLLSSGDLAAPTLVIASNNSQIVPHGGFGAQTNLLPLPDPDTSRFTGLSVMHSILLDYLSEIPVIRNVAICGNGFINAKKPYGPFLYSNNKELAAAVNLLSVRDEVFGPDPGDVLLIRENGAIITALSEFIKLNTVLNNEFYAKRERFIQHPIPQEIEPLTACDRNISYSERLLRVQAELNRLAPMLLVSQTGKRMLEQNTYLDGPLGPHRAVFRLLSDRDPVHLAFDVTSCSFVPICSSARDALRSFPFGVEVYLDDLFNVFDGIIQIWDLAGTSMRNWYLGTKYESLVAFLFTAVGEQARPDLALKIYRSAIARLGLQ